MTKKSRTVVAKVRTRIGLSDEFIEQGTAGHIIVTRRLPGDPERLALVKWKGRGGHCSHLMSELTLTSI
jgi:hypothetical protein